MMTPDPAPCTGRLSGNGGCLKNSRKGFWGRFDQGEPVFSTLLILMLTTVGVSSLANMVNGLVKASWSCPEMTGALEAGDAANSVFVQFIPDATTRPTKKKAKATAERLFTPKRGF